MKKSNKTIAKETIDILENGFTTEKRIHQGYLEYENAKKNHIEKINKFKLKQGFGKWQYIFEKGDMKISLIKVMDRPFNEKAVWGGWIWEIHAFEDKRLFEDVKKFATKKDAMKMVKNILGE